MNVFSDDDLLREALSAAHNELHASLTAGLYRPRQLRSLRIHCAMIYAVHREYPAVVAHLRSLPIPDPGFFGSATEAERFQWSQKIAFCNAAIWLARGRMMMAEEFAARKRPKSDPHADTFGPLSAAPEPLEYDEITPSGNHPTPPRIPRMRHRNQ